jgi:hypothetical protein
MKRRRKLARKRLPPSPKSHQRLAYGLARSMVAINSSLVRPI